MTPENKTLPNAPIIEAVVDLDCDLPPHPDPDQLAEEARNVLGNTYPKFRKTLLHEQTISQQAQDPPQIQIKAGVGALQFVSEDEKQLLQFRPNGFSFNRLAPYQSLDDYFAEIEKGWEAFKQLTHPVMIRKIGIRMINRILLPMSDGRLDMGRYLTVHPQLPETGSPLSFLGFFDQHTAIDSETGNHIRIVKTTENPKENHLPLILDIEAFYPCEWSPDDWAPIRERLDSLRSLKNRVFRNTIKTKTCLNPSSPPA